MAKDSGAVVFRRGNPDVFLPRDVLEISGNGNVVNHSTSGSPIISVYSGTSSRMGHYEMNLPVGDYTFQYKRLGVAETYTNSFRIDVLGGSDIAFVNLPEFITKPPGQPIFFRFGGRVDNNEILGGTGSGNPSGIQVDIYKLEPGTASRATSDPNYHIYSGTTGPDGEWGPASIEEGTYLEVVTTTSKHALHEFIDYFGRYGGIDILEAVITATDETIDPALAPLGGVILFRKGPNPFTYSPVSMEKDKLVVDIDRDTLPETDIIVDETIPDPPGSTYRVSLYETSAGLNYNGHYDSPIDAGEYRFTWDWQWAEGDTPTAGVVRVDTSVTPGFDIAYYRPNGKICPLPYWLSTYGGSDHCIKGPLALAAEVLYLYYSYIPEPPPLVPGEGHYFTSLMVDDDYLRHTDVRPRFHELRPSLVFDDHHILTNTRFSVASIACDMGGSDHDCICSRMTPYSELARTANKAWVDLKAVKDMRLWYIQRACPDPDEGNIAEDPFDYQMTFITSSGDIVIYTHAKDPLGIGVNRIDALVEGTEPDPINHPDKLFSLEGTISNGVSSITPRHEDAPGYCDRALYPDFPAYSVYFPHDPNSGNFDFHSGDVIGKMRFKPYASDTQCFVNIDMGILTGEHDQLAITEMYTGALRDTLLPGLLFGADGLFDRDQWQPFMENMGTFEMCQYSSNPRVRSSAVLPIPEPRFYDNRPWCEVNRYGDNLNKSDAFSLSMAPQEVYNFYNCLDYRSFLESRPTGGIIPPASESTPFAYEIKRVPVIVDPSSGATIERSHILNNYFAYLSDYDAASGTTVYRNFLWHAYSRSWPGSGPLADFGVIEADCDGATGNELMADDPQLSGLCYHKFLYVKTVAGPVGIQICGSNSESTPDWATCGPRYSECWAPSLIGFLNWE